MWYRIRDATNNSEMFLSDIEEAIMDGFLRRRGVLVLDNVAYHNKKAIAVLADWVWTGLKYLFYFCLNGRQSGIQSSYCGHI